MDPVRLILPPAVSSNRYWRSFVPRGHKRAIVTLSDEAKAYKAAVAQIARKAGVVSPIKGRVAVSYTLFPKRPQDYAKRMKADPLRWDDTVQCLDLDNALKVILDSLKGIVFEDDKFVHELHGRRAEPDGEGRLEVVITPIVVESAQPSLI